MVNREAAIVDDLPNVNRTANTALYEAISVGGTYADIADRLKTAIATLKASGAATGDVLSGLTSGIFIDADADRALGVSRNRPLEEHTEVDQISLLRGLLERNSLTHTQMRSLVQEFLTRFRAINAQVGLTDSEKALKIRSLLLGIQFRPQTRVGLTSDNSITELLGVATGGLFNRSDVFWPTDAWADHPITDAANRTLLESSLQTYIDLLPVTPPPFDLFANLVNEINFTSFTAVDRNRLLAAIRRAFPDTGRVLGELDPPALSAADQSVVSRLAGLVRKDFESLVSRVISRPQALRTETELRQDITKGADVYVDRSGAFYVGGVRTRPMDLGVVTRYLVQDKLSAEYKVLMDDMNERNNQITAARSLVETLTGIVNGDYPKPAGNSSSNDTYWKEQVLGPKLTQLQATLGSADILSDLTGGKYRFVNATTWRDGSGVGVIVDLTVRDDLKALLNTLISNKIRDGDLSQSKLQALTAQMQNNIEAMSALIKVFNEATKTLAQALR
jgi:hypothetical protein